MIFLSFRFSVKSILGNLNSLVLNLPFFAIFEALNFANLVNFNLQKVQKVIKVKIQCLEMWLNG